MAQKSIYLRVAARVSLAILVTLLLQTTERWSCHLSPLPEFTALVANAQNLDDTLLHSGEALKRSLGGGDTHTYLLELQKGNYAHMIVEQWVIESEIALLDPNGQLILQLNSRNRELTPVSVIAKAPGAYRLTLRSHEPKGTSGEYQLKVVETRLASRQDEYRIVAETAFARAEELRKTGDEVSKRKAIP